MKNSRAMIENRRKRILMELQKNGTVNVQAISEELNASPLTIRRDLAYLEEQGTVHRHYGGATICAGIERKEFHTDDLLSCREACGPPNLWRMGTLYLLIAHPPR